ncbi:TonB-dependent receptor plug domain-containing protein [Parashewanella tropica]|uniref:TonB-dependent receptor plug domain-containing protein n=1 Tax=Parashewanella tropica TaxID=2547970 RepID=UPI001059974C|nr:TonB-dependent receptor [Parashewanella tropica]
MQANAVLAKAVRLALIAGATSATLSTANVIAAEESANVERIQVTGSRIKRTDMETANPVVVLSADDMAKQGFTNVQDALENLSATTGAVTTQSVHGYTPSASAISLRGAGANRTLTLINGKRLNQYPKFLNGTDNFVDTANLPMEAVARVEILQSGASAIYGADAVGGVINIILKRDFEGIALKARRGDTTHGGGANSRVALSLGSSSERGNVSSFVELNFNEQLKTTDRANFGLDTDKVPHSVKSKYSSYGARIAPNSKGAKGQRALNQEQCETQDLLWDKANNRCGYDRSKQRDLSPESYRFISSTIFNYELTDDTIFNGRIDFAKAKSTTLIEPTSTDGVDVEVKENKVNVNAYGRKFTYNKADAFGGDFANAEDGKYYYIRRLNGLGNRKGETNTQNYYGSFALEGTLADEYSWDVSANYGKTDLDVFNSGYSLEQKIVDYITSEKNGKSLLDPISKDAYKKLEYTPHSRATSSLLNFQANISGVALQLPNGNDLEFALGSEWSKQKYRANADTESKAGNVVGTGGSSGQGERSFYAVYSELRVPVLDELTFDLALRYDKYSDFGGNVTPSIAVEYRPIDELLVRGSYNKVFRAPDMQRVYGDPSTGFSQVTDVKRCLELGGTPDKVIKGLPDNVNTVCNELHIDITTGANPDLKAEKGYTANVGAVYGTDELNVSIDVWEWKLNDMVTTVSASRKAREHKLYEKDITRDAQGKITHINSVAQNLSFKKVSGIDLEGGYTYEMDALGELSFKTKATYLLKSESQIDAASPVDDDIDDGGIARLKGSFVTAWNYQDFTTTLGMFYTARHHGASYKSVKANSKNFDEKANEVASYVKWNFTSIYNVSDDVQIKAGILNLFDKGPNFDPTLSSWPHYERSLFNARGREWFVETEVKF